MKSDEIWDQFGIATRRVQLVRLRAALAAGLALAAVAAAFWGSGAITPHIHWLGRNSSMYVDAHGELTAVVSIDFENEGITPFVLTGISAEMPGLRFSAMERPEDEMIADPGQLKIVETQLVITDCTAVPHEPQPIRFTYRTWLGDGVGETVWESRHLSGPAGSVPIAWQQGLAMKICDEAVSQEWH